jgi:hypothetical protein
MPPALEASHSFEPQNDLERSLMQAATDPAHRPQFYRDLARSDVFIIRHGADPPRTDQRHTLQQGMTPEIQNIQHEGKLYAGCDPGEAWPRILTTRRRAQSARGLPRS